MTRMAFWRAWSVWAVSVTVTATALVFTRLYPLPASVSGQSGSPADGVVAVVFIGSFATVGALLGWKRPANPIGWLLAGTGLAYAIGAFGLVLTYFPATRTLAARLGWIWLFGGALCVFVLLLFPSGKLPSRRWRPAAWAAGIGLAGWVLGNAFAPDIITANQPTPNPFGLTGLAGHICKIMAIGGLLLILVGGLAAMLSLAFRYRRARAAERAQLKWLVYAGGLILLAVLAQFLPGQIMGGGDAASNLANAIISGALAFVPIAICIAVLRYHLYDIDRVISRTLAYAMITGLLAAVYAGLVLLATEVLGLSSPVAVAAATLAAAALFRPVRRRVQRLVDRRFNRVRYDADTTTAAFAARLKDAVDLDAIRDDLASVVQAALEPAHVSVWLPAVARGQPGETASGSAGVWPARSRA
jgi:hypothetical protein